LRSEEPKVQVVIPVYNHADSLREVVCGVLAVHLEVLVVDDGSTDGGADVLAGLDVPIVRHPHNLGKGAAILTAAREARRLGVSHIITIDADGQHDPHDIRQFLDVIREAPDTIVVGKRDFNTPNVPFPSRFGRGFSNFWVRVQTGISVGDTQSGFRAYPVAVFEHLRLREQRYAFEIEVLVKSAWGGVELRDVNIAVHYPPKEERISHFRFVVDNLRISWLNTHLTMRSVFPVPRQKILCDDPEEQRIGLRHPFRSLKRLLSEDASPRSIALAGGLGIFLGALPLIACHTVAILYVAGYFRLKKMVALGTSQLCAPPLVPALCIEAGYFMRHGRFLTEISLRTLGYQAPARVFEWLLGSLVLGPVLATVVGLFVYGAASRILRRSGGNVENKEQS